MTRQGWITRLTALAKRLKEGGAVAVITADEYEEIAGLLDTGFQPIATLPKDVDWFLGYSPESPRRGTNIYCQFEDGMIGCLVAGFEEGEGKADHLALLPLFPPTLWMAVPQPLQAMS